MTLEAFIDEWQSDSPYVSVHTSGSTGKPKPLLVEKCRMEASARATCNFLRLKRGDTALLCLPLDYIAGKMMVVRALTCGLRLESVEPGGHPLLDRRISALADQQFDFAAMVPLQVWNSLQTPVERHRLMQIRHLIIGGGAIDDALAQELRQFPNNVWSTYGMTETLSHIAMRRLNGPDATEWYTPLPGVSIALSADGCLMIDAPAVCPEPLVTNDMAVTAPIGSAGAATAFRILGRKDNVICSGGIKIQAEEVEALLRPHLKAPFCITRKKDERLGEAVVLLTTEGDTERIAALCRQVLPRYWMPRHYVSTPTLPMTETGKIARGEAEKIVATKYGC